MRLACCILATWTIGGAALLTGCAAHKPDEPAAQLTAPQPEAQLASARVLAFDPVLPGGVPFDLSRDLDRDARQPGAYAGFDTQTISTYQVFQQDNQRIFSDRNGLEYQRSSYTWRTGTNYR